jgi:membrane-associated protease RseP (regulator of RpoE activity)
MRTSRGRVWLLVAAVACVAPAFADDDPQALQQKIDAARARLDAAARELAELHKQDTFNVELPGPPSRVSLGVLLMPGNGVGVSVAGVTPGGAAAEAGIAAGDVLVAINGTNLRDANAPTVAKMFDALKDVTPGEVVHVDYLRGGETQSADLTAREPLPAPVGGFAISTMAFGGAPPGAMTPSGPPPVDVAYSTSGSASFSAAMPMGALGGRAMVGGIELFDVDESLGHYFGVTEGVLVLRAPLDKDGGGLIAGDVVKSIGGRAVATSADCVSALAGKAATVEVLRDGSLLSVDVKASSGPTLITMPGRAVGRVEVRESGATNAPERFDVLVARPIPE